MKLRASTFVTVFPICSVLLVIACSSDESKPVPTGPAAATPGTADDVEKALSARAKSYCDRVFGCCDDATKSLVLTTYANDGNVSRDKCEAAIKEYLKSSRTAVLTALERKDLTFYPSKEATCLKDDEAKSCVEFFDLRGQTAPKLACAASFTGKLKEGASCSTNGACESGYCKIETELGKCTPRAEEGAECASSEDCVEGLYCHRTGAPPQCKFGGTATCKAKEDKADGSDCCNAEECASRNCAATNKGPKCLADKTFKCDK